MSHCTYRRCYACEFYNKQNIIRNRTRHRSGNRRFNRQTLDALLTLRSHNKPRNVTVESKKESNIDTQLMKCPIGYEIMKDPVIAQDGITYERANIERWLRRNSSSPITRQNIELSTLIPNIIVKQLIEQIKRQVERD